MDLIDRDELNLHPKYANAEVMRWGVVDGQLCVVIRIDEEVF